MAYQGQEIANPRTGQRMRFTHISEAELVIDTVNPPRGEREPLHVHPHQESGCEVLSGNLVFEIDAVRHDLGPGAALTIPAGTAHRFWNEGTQDARSRQFFRPALDTASFFETLFSLAESHQLRANGMPRLLPLAALVQQFGDEIRPVSPPWPLLRAIALLLAPFAQQRKHCPTPGQSIQPERSR